MPAAQTSASDASSATTIREGSGATAWTLLVVVAPCPAAAAGSAAATAAASSAAATTTLNIIDVGSVSNRSHVIRCACAVDVQQPP